MCHTKSAKVSEHLNGYISACNHSNRSRKCLTWSWLVALIVAKRIKSLAQLLHAQISAQTQQPLISWLTKNYWKKCDTFSIVNWSTHPLSYFSFTLHLGHLQRKGDQICDHISVLDNMDMISKHLVELWFWHCTTYIQFKVESWLERLNTPLAGSLGNLSFSFHCL